MCKQENETIECDCEARDAYDEFEQRIGRIGIGIVTVWRKLEVSEKVGHALALATLIALIVYAGYTIKIYRANRDAADTAQGQLKQMISQAKDDQRAWVGAVGIKITQYAPAFRTEIALINSGKSPALNLKRASGYILPCTLESGPTPNDIKLIEDKLASIRDHIAMPPSVTSTLEVSDDGTQVTPKWPAITRKTATEFLCVYGKLEYDDVANRRHSTTFCYYLKDPTAKPLPQFASCESYNDMN
jgi:hypothetical protein